MRGRHGPPNKVFQQGCICQWRAFQVQTCLKNSFAFAVATERYDATVLWSSHPPLIGRVHAHERRDMEFLGVSVAIPGTVHAIAIPKNVPVTLVPGCITDFRYHRTQLITLVKAVVNIDGAEIDPKVT